MSYYDDKPAAVESLPRITRLGIFWALVFYAAIPVAIFISIKGTELRITNTQLIIASLLIPVIGIWRGCKRDGIVDQHIRSLRDKTRRLEMAASEQEVDETTLSMVLAHLPVLWAIFAAEMPELANDRKQFALWLIGYVNRPGYHQVWRNSFYHDMDLPDTEQLDFEAMVKATADLAYVKGYLRHVAELPD